MRREDRDTFHSEGRLRLLDMATCRAPVVPRVSLSPFSVGAEHDLDRSLLLEETGSPGASSSSLLTPAGLVVVGGSLMRQLPGALRRPWTRTTARARKWGFRQGECLSERPWFDLGETVHAQRTASKVLRSTSPLVPGLRSLSALMQAHVTPTGVVRRA